VAHTLSNIQIGSRPIHRRRRHRRRRRRRRRRFKRYMPCVLMRRFIMPLDYSGMGLSPTTLSRLNELTGANTERIPEANRRQKARRESLPEADAARVRDADAAAHVRARASQSESDAARIRDANAAAHVQARASQSEPDAARVRDANAAAHMRARGQLRVWMTLRHVPGHRQTITQRAGKHHPRG